MSIDKAFITTIEKWLKCGSIEGINDHLYLITSSDHCRAIENIKKSGTSSKDLTSNCNIVCEQIISFDLTKQNLIAALYDEKFCECHVSRNQNGLSIASYVSLYYQDCYPEEKEGLIQDIEF